MGDRQVTEPARASSPSPAGAAPEYTIAMGKWSHTKWRPRFVSSTCRSRVASCSPSTSAMASVRASVRLMGGACASRGPNVCEA